MHAAIKIAALWHNTQILKHTEITDTDICFDVKRIWIHNVNFFIKHDSSLKLESNMGNINQELEQIAGLASQNRI
ncbi:hypothetical protein ACJX0J_021528, partial [Zea mays]